MQVKSRYQSGNYKGQPFSKLLRDVVPRSTHARTLSTHTGMHAG